MNFLSTLSLLETRFAEQGVAYALIGGFAMALRGVQAAGAAKNPLDWDLLSEYLSLFGQEARLEELCALYREQGA